MYRLKTKDISDLRETITEESWILYWTIRERKLIRASEKNVLEEVMKLKQLIEARVFNEKMEYQIWWEDGRYEKTIKDGSKGKTEIKEEQILDDVLSRQVRESLGLNGKEVIKIKLCKEIDFDEMGQAYIISVRLKNLVHS